MSGATGWEFLTYLVYFLGFAMFGMFLFAAVCLFKRRRRSSITYVGDRYSEDAEIDYIPPRTPYTSLGAFTRAPTPLTVGADPDTDNSTEITKQQERERT